jgi:D-glycero-D-manno-heptose 1,7-bisphosphate phosphatase
MTAPVVVLDRDGTINIDRHYISDPGQLEFLPNAALGLQRLHAMGCRLVIVTNQSGVGRGYFSLEDLERVHRRLQEMIAELGVTIEGIYFCPHRPDEGCACRKPGTELIERAGRELGFDPAKSVVIGDKTSDVEFGKAAGARTILISPEIPDLNAAAEWIKRL